jgi:hypothetical protein
LFYDWGYKNVQVYTRVEEYWATDCGWWYIGDTETVAVNLTDAAGEELNITQGLSTSKGRVEFTYLWGTDDDPGLWTVTVNATDGGGAAVNTATFTIYVRGKLQLSSVGFNTSTPNVGEKVRISASITDHAGNSIANNHQDNNGTSTPLTVTAYVTGAGEAFEVTLEDDGTGADDTANDGIWKGDTPAFAAMGDHKVKVKAEDGHQYWVEGSGSGFVSVKGTFPYASILLSFVERMVGGLAGKINLQALGGLLAALSGLLLGKRWYLG